MLARFKQPGLDRCISDDVGDAYRKKISLRSTEVFTDKQYSCIMFLKQGRWTSKVM